MAVADVAPEFPNWLLDADKALQSWTEARAPAEPVGTPLVSQQASSAPAVPPPVVATGKSSTPAVPQQLVAAAKPLDANVISAIDGLAAASMTSLLGGAPPPAEPPVAHAAATRQAAPSQPVVLSQPAALSVEELSAFDPLLQPRPPPADTLAAPLVPAPSAAAASPEAHEAPVSASPWSPAPVRPAPSAAAPKPAAAAEVRPPPAAVASDGAARQLAVMFPTLDDEIVAAVLRAAGSTEAAVDQLLQMTAEPNASRPRAAAPAASQTAAAGRITRVPPARTSAFLPPEPSAPQVTFKKGFFRSGPRVA